MESAVVSKTDASTTTESYRKKPRRNRRNYFRRPSAPIQDQDDQQQQRAPMMEEKRSAVENSPNMSNERQPKKEKREENVVRRPRPRPIDKKTAVVVVAAAAANEIAGNIDNNNESSKKLEDDKENTKPKNRSNYRRRRRSSWAKDRREPLANVSVNNEVSMSSVSPKNMSPQQPQKNYYYYPRRGGGPRGGGGGGGGGVGQVNRQPVSATEFVTRNKAGIKLVENRSLPYSMLPPKECDHSKMAMVRLTNVDSGMDRSGNILFLAFKKYGYVQNIYIDETSFYKGRGTAFIGYRRDTSARAAVNSSGTEELFGRRIGVILYANRRRVNITALPPDLMAKVFAQMDWRTRVRCEAVSKRFNSQLKQMYETDPRLSDSDEPALWGGLPAKFGIVFEPKQVTAVEKKEKGQGDSALATAGINTDVINIRYMDNEHFKEVFRSALRKFRANIKSLELRNVEIDSEVVHLLRGGGKLLYSLTTNQWDAGRVILKKCTVSGATSEEFIHLMEFYGDRLMNVED